MFCTWGELPLACTWLPSHWVPSQQRENQSKFSGVSSFVNTKPITNVPPSESPLNLITSQRSVPKYHPTGGQGFNIRIWQDQSRVDGGHNSIYIMFISLFRTHFPPFFLAIFCLACLITSLVQLGAISDFLLPYGECQQVLPLEICQIKLRQTVICSSPAIFSKVQAIPSQVTTKKKKKKKPK